MTIIAKSAITSRCEDYRYVLTRRVDETQWERAVFVMLNPSTADASKDDPTIRRCMGFAERWGVGRVQVLNLFAFRSTRPARMFAAKDPVGPDNDEYIARVLQERFNIARVVVAWGAANQEIVKTRAAAVMSLLREAKVVPRCLGRCKNGGPRHPLMVPYSTELVEWTGYEGGPADDPVRRRDLAV